MNPTERQVLEVLSSNMSFDNIIVVIKPIKEKLSKITGKSYETIRSSIQGLVNKGILIRKKELVIELIQDTLLKEMARYKSFTFSYRL